jgi:DNA-binding MarR family transcriptional regulator
MEKFDDKLPAVINKVAIRMRLELGKLFAENNLDISIDQFVVLNRLYENQGISQNELANLTYKDKSSITRIIDLLEAKGYVERQAVPGDRRAYKIFAKQKAFDILPLITKLMHQNIERATKGFTNEEITGLISLLNKIHSNYQ